MPPKSKKEQEDEAKRLEQQQRKREQQEAKLAEQRKRYLHQTISTGLYLPASNQLLVEMYTQTVAFVSTKLQQNILVAYQQLRDHNQYLKLLVKQLINYMADALIFFKLEGVKSVEGNTQQLLKGRVLVGLALKIMMNKSVLVGGNGKSKSDDQAHLKQLLMLHVQKGEGKLRLLNLKQTQGILKMLRGGYFNHYLLLFNHNQFSKRQDVQRHHVYLNTPTSFNNRKDTPFTDLTHKIAKAEQPEQPHQ